VFAATYRWFEFTVLVRDLDPQAHMANHVYVAYLSEARARWMRHLDPDGRLFRPSVVADVHVKYVSSLLPRDTFRVGVAVTRVGMSSVTFGYRVEAGDGRLVVEADSVEVMLDAQTRRPRPLSAEARRALGADATGARGC
jgi:YbgC/YbaW family acyl-CoA thioester hydrolase